MSSFSSIISSIGQKPQAAQQSAQPGQQARQSNSTSNGGKLTPNNAAVGVKRRSEEPESNQRPKSVKTGQDGGGSRPGGAAPSNRFQLSGKGGPPQKPSPKPTTTSKIAPSRPGVTGSAQRPIPKPTESATPTPPNGPAPAKRGFASIMEKAKAAQEAAKAAGPATIKHKAVDKMTKREKLRMLEEQKAQQKGAAKGGEPGSQPDRSRSGTPVVAGKPAKRQPQELAYKGTMKKPAEPLAYKGTMRAAGTGVSKEKEKKKGEAQDKYGGYASWSDLDDAEDEEEDYDSEGSSDMEAGVDDMEREEFVSTRTAHREDQEAAEEEARLKREKLERKKKLQELNKSAAGKKRY